MSKREDQDELKKRLKEISYNERRTGDEPGHYEITPEQDNSRRIKLSHAERIIQSATVDSRHSNSRKVHQAAKRIFDKLQKRLGAEGNPFAEENDLLTKAAKKMAKAQSSAGADFSGQSPDDIAKTLIDTMEGLAQKALARRGRSAS